MITPPADGVGEDSSQLAHPRKKSEHDWLENGVRRINHRSGVPTTKLAKGQVCCGVFESLLQLLRPVATKAKERPAKVVAIGSVNGHTLRGIPVRFRVSLV